MEMREQPSKEDLARSQSDSVIPLATTTPAAIARPILPAPINSATSTGSVPAEDVTASTPTPTARRRRSPQERKSTAGSETTTSASEGSKKASDVKKKKKSAWRRLLCGGAQDG